ncbi:unnamed protein product [Gemmata massiliana]|uniref:Uncharacterized protein n=1 Tax=Gemmata massiliana TaxID=1210884 RepID=A0A6P2DH39_9BACT|nr:hypothetical protein [Gemmata massiliana]VTS02106.1 unnamed protein product [Gemmata massiliana]
MTAQLPKFRRFERVLVVDEPAHYPELLGKSGTVLWRDAIPVHRQHLAVNKWLYLVHFAAENVYRTLLESTLRSEESFEAETTHLGKRPEFSFDVIADDDMSFVEGTYRLPGRFWEVMIFLKANVPALFHRPNQPPLEWPSGITGAIFHVPDRDKLNREYVRNALVTAFTYSDWVEVAGPDSMVLR